MAKYQKLVNRAEMLMTPWAAAYEHYAQYARGVNTVTKRMELRPKLDDARNALLGFIGSLAGRNDQQQEVINELREGIEALKAELATYKPQIPDGLPFDLEAAKAGKPMQVRVIRTRGKGDDETLWFDIRFIGIRADGSIVYETDQYGLMHSNVFAAFRMVPQAEQVTLWANVYPIGHMAERRGHLFETEHDARTHVGNEAIMTAVPVTLTVVK